MKNEKSVKFLVHLRKNDATEQSVQEHFEEVSTISKDLAGKIGLATCGELIGLLHDIGKYSSAFQSYIRSAIGQLNPDEDDYVDAKGKKGK